VEGAVLSAQTTIERAKTEGVTLEIRKGVLWGKGKKPTPELSSQINQHKAEIIALLKRASFKAESQNFLFAARKYWPDAKIVDERLKPAASG
jgi:hypothetical protein